MRHRLGTKSNVVWDVWKARYTRRRTIHVRAFHSSLSLPLAAVPRWAGAICLPFNTLDTQEISGQSSPRSLAIAWEMLPLFFGIWTKVANIEGDRLILDLGTIVHMVHAPRDRARKA